MSIALYDDRSTAHHLAFALCPTFADTCGCENDAAHPVYHFAVEPPEECSVEDWRERCLREACLLEAQQRREHAPLSIASLPRGYRPTGN